MAQRKHLRINTSGYTNRVTTRIRQTTVGVIVHRTPKVVFDRESVHVKSIEKIDGKNEPTEVNSMEWLKGGLTRLEFGSLRTWFCSVEALAYSCGWRCWYLRDLTLHKMSRMSKISSVLGLFRLSIQDEACTAHELKI